MPMRTRFNPTANGPLHLGHAYMALVNQAEAHRTRGIFVLRIEDDQDFWIWKCGAEKTRQYCEDIVSDLDWLGIVADTVYLQSQKHSEVKRAYDLFLQNKWFDVECKFTFMAAQVHGMDEVVFYPYAPRLTIDKVIMDALDSINLLIRGFDLVTENNFYEFCCDLLGIIPPHMHYLPRLVKKDGGQLIPLSKTEGGFKISDYRNRGYKPDDVLDLLRQSCLIDPSGSWLISNVKDNPIWVG